MLNTSRGVPREVLNEILSKFARKLINSGFSIDEAQRFLVCSACSYIHKVMKSELEIDHPSYAPLYKSRNYKRDQRDFLKINAKTQ